MQKFKNPSRQFGPVFCTDRFTCVFVFLIFYISGIIQGVFSVTYYFFNNSDYILLMAYLLKLPFNISIIIIIFVKIGTLNFCMKVEIIHIYWQKYLQTF